MFRSKDSAPLTPPSPPASGGRGLCRVGAARAYPKPGEGGCAGQVARSLR
jgi:hypothetical protein